MSKRGAEEYITKEHGSTPNSLSEEGKVKMATAAQMAKRKMAVPKSRAGRSGVSPLPGAGAGSGSSNPFANTSTFGASQSNQNQNPTFQNPGGITFGASQSFPAGNSGSSGFNFTAPGQSSSFTFGQPTPNNPFASLNGDTRAQEPQQSEDAMMESPQKKPAFGSGGFGSNSNENTTQPSTFSFGQSTSQPAFSFGQNQTNGVGASSSSPLFGQNQSKPDDQSTSTNIFGQSTQDKGSMPTSNLFGQSTSAPSQQSLPSTFSFGQSTSPNPSSAPTFGFGQTSTQPSSNTASFGSTTQTAPSGFGSSVSAPPPSTSAPAFGGASTSTSTNIFGGFGTPKSSETESEQKSKPLFGQSTAAAEPEKPATESVRTPEAPKNPFAGLFGQNSSKPTTSETPKPLFSFAAPTQSNQLFGAPKTDNKDTTGTGTTSQTPKKLFDLGSSTTTPSSTLFGSSKPSADQPAVSANPFAGLSSQKPKTAEASADKPAFGSGVESAKKPENSFQPLPSFGTTPAREPATTPASTSSNLFGTLNKPQSTTPAPAEKRPTESTNLQQQPSKPTFTFGTSSTPKPQEQSQQSSNIFSSTPKPAAATPSIPSAAPKPAAVGEAPKRTVNTNPPTRIPPYLSGDDYKAYDSNYRLHSLNREFKKRVAALDPSRDDFENIVRNYVAARESIGESIGLYTRNMAGMKRKADSPDDDGGNDSVSKKTKGNDTSSSQTLFGRSQPSSSVFQPVPSSSPSKQAGNTMSFSASVPASSTSSLFSSMIPKSAGGSSEPEPKPNNPFANLPKSTSNSSDASAKPSFTFAPGPNASTATGSTTPTQSPSKKPTFEMPKFSTAGTNFMDAFKKQSEASAKRFAKEAKEKRKAEEFDSDEDDEDEWERKYEEEEKAKRAQVESIGKKGFTPIFGSSIKPDLTFGGTANTSTTISKPTAGFVFNKSETGKSSDKPIDISDNDTNDDEDYTPDNEDSTNTDEDDEEAEDDDLPEDQINGEEDEEEEQDEEDEDLETVLARSRNQGKSLFDRVTPNPANQNGTVTKPTATSVNGKAATEKSNVFESIGKKATTDTSSSLFGSTVTKEPYVPSKTFNFTPTPPASSSTPVFGASIFAGGAMKEGPVAGEGLFGSRPSTPSNADQGKPNVFAGLGAPSSTPSADHTWKKGSEIKFGSPEKDTPTFNITEATPRKDDNKPFANLFGAGSSGNDPSSNGSIGFSFGQTPVPGYLAATSHLTGNSGTSSGLSSRATSPGTTDNESVATNEEDYSNDKQVSLMESRPGEENEQVLVEVKARAMRNYSQEQIQGTKLEVGWNVMGLGMVRILKNKETGKSRLVMRADPGANIILNINLQPEVKYVYAPSKTNGTVTFMVFTSGEAQSWLLKVKTHESGQELAKVMEENKTVKV